MYGENYVILGCKLFWNNKPAIAIFRVPTGNDEWRIAMPEHVVYKILKDNIDKRHLMCLKNTFARNSF